MKGLDKDSLTTKDVVINVLVVRLFLLICRKQSVFCIFTFAIY